MKRGSSISKPQEPRWIGLSVGSLAKNLCCVKHQYWVGCMQSRKTAAKGERGGKRWNIPIH